MHNLINEIVEGTEYPIWDDQNKLCVALVWKCEHCNQYGYVNAKYLSKDNHKEFLRLCIQQANIFKNQSIEFSELNSDEFGGTICGDCSKKLN